MLDSAHAARLERRAAAKRARQKRRLQAGSLAALVLIIVVAIAVIAGGGGASPSTRNDPSHAKTVPKPKPIPGGPLAPLRFGGLASLWAAANVVGLEPGTAAAYSAAARLQDLPGYLLIADRGNNRILVVTPRHRIVFRFPDAADLAAGRHLFFDDDVFVEPGGRYLISNQEEDHSIVQIGIANHSLQLLFGHPGQVGGDATHLNFPDDAYELTNGSFTVADAYNCRILFVKAKRIIREYGHSGDCHHDPPRAFGPVNGDTPLPGGGVLVSEIPGSWIDEIGADGRLRIAVQAPVGYPSDPQPLPGGRILLADYSSPGHVLIINRHGRVLWRYGPSSGPGMLNHPSLAMALPNGDIVVNDDFRDRCVVIDPRTNRIVWQYGHTDVSGTAPGFLNTPDGMDFIPAAPNGSPDWAAVVHP